MSDSWLELSMRLPDHALEAVEECLLESGALAVTLRSDPESESAEQLLEPDPGAMPLWRELALVALFEQRQETTVLLACIARLQSDFAVTSVMVKGLSEQDWQNAWRQHVKEMVFADRLIVRPFTEPGEDRPVADMRSEVAAKDSSIGVKNDCSVVFLEPGLAFGTGSHPTTAMCLERLASLPLQGKRVVDYGSGSGILALAAAALGAEQVLAVDHDEQALAATAMNRDRNEIDEQSISCWSPQAFAAEFERARWPGFDVLVANILAGPLAALAPELDKYLDRAGVLILAGVLEDQVPQLLAAYQGRRDLKVGAQIDQWVRLDG